MTSLSFDVTAVQECFYAGPYAKFAQKYLGVSAKQQDGSSFRIESIKITPFIEADQSSRHIVILPKGTSAGAWSQMTSQGLVSIKDGHFGNESVWRFPARKEGDFSGKGISSNLTSESATLYKTVKQESSYNKVAIQQDMVVEKSLERKAQEAAEMIFSLRKTRIQIITGDTDANYSGEAMASALEELARLEKEYMSLFVGYSEYQTQEKTFDLVPANDPDSKMTVIFRLSDTEGLLPSDNMSGKPYIMEITPQEIAQTGNAANYKGTASIIYRIPAICTVKISDGVHSLLQSRIPIYQFGADKSYPIK